MKHGKWIISLVLIIGLCVVMVPFVGTTQAARILTFDRAVQINDYQIVMEFSEPIAINLKQTNSGPYCAIRLVTNEKNELGRSKEGTILQWKGTIEYADANHDKLLWTMADNRLGMVTVNDILNYRGALAPYSEYKAKLCIEEIPYNTTVPAATGLLDNVTTADGEVHLSANRPIGYDGAYCPIEINYNYPIDLTKTESLTKSEVSAQIGVATQTLEPSIENAEATAEYDPLIVAVIFGGSALAAIALVVVGIVVKKRRKAA